MLICGLAWALALNLPFERLISIDLILYGSSLLLEFVALIVLRIREPQLPAAIQGRQLSIACLSSASAPLSSSPTRSMLRAPKSSAIPTPLSRMSHLYCLRRPSACLARRSTGSPLSHLPAGVKHLNQQ